VSLSQTIINHLKSSEALLPVKAVKPTEYVPLSPTFITTLLLSFCRQVAGGCMSDHSSKQLSVGLAEDVLFKHSLQSNVCFDNTPQGQPAINQF